MTIFRSVLALFLILMTGTVFAAPKGGGGGPTDLMRGYYSCSQVSDNGYYFRVNVESATFIEANEFNNTVDIGPIFECDIHLDRIDLLAAPYCQSYYANPSTLMMVCRGTREEMVGLLADMQEDVLNPTQ